MTEKYYGWGLPIDISAHGWQIDRLIYIIHGLMAVLFVGWMIFIIIALVRFHQTKHPKAEYRPHHHFVLPTYAEVAVAIAEVILLCAFAFPIFSQVRNEPPPEDQALKVRVVAEQFAWNIHYPGTDGVFGKTDVHLISPTNPLGLDSSDPAAKDDITTINQLQVPVDTPVIAQLSSKDVMHSFTLPVMRVKQDMIPGQNIRIWFEAKKAGNFEIACAQLCGLGHYRMRGFFNVKSKEEFAAWLEQEHLKKTGQTTAAAGETA